MRKGFRAGAKGTEYPTASYWQRQLDGKVYPRKEPGPFEQRRPVGDGMRRRKRTGRANDQACAPGVI